MIDETEPVPSRIYPPLADRVVVVTGATATGKSEAAIELAEKVDGELLSLDSIAVYRKMDIGTAKPTAQQRARVPHHLIDLVEPDEEFSVAQYMALAHAKVKEILDRGHVPVFVGGTPMYLKGILRGFDPGPPADPEFRQSVQEDVDRHGAAALHERLRQVDPISARKIDAADVRRMIRALEVARTTGYPISHRQTQFNAPVDASRTNAFAIRWQRAELHRRIDRRTETMFQSGLAEEVRELLGTPRGLSKTAAQAVGYREIIEMVRATPSPTSDDLAVCQEQVAAHTRQLARRQETWLRSFEEIRWIEAAEGVDLTSEIRRQLTA